MSLAVSQRPQKFEWLISTDDRPDAFDRYRATLANLYQVTGVSPEDIAAFRTHAIGAHLGTAIMVRYSSVAQTFVRTAAEIQRSGYDHFNILVDISGHVTADYDGKAVNSGPGSVRFMDTSRELRTSLTAFEMINFVVPRSRVPAKLLAMDLHGVVLDADLGMTRILHQHVLQLFEDADTLSDSEADAAIDATFALIEGALAGRPQVEPEQTQSIHRTVRGAAKTYIDAHLSDQRLAPTQIADTLEISRSVLYRAFDSYGGVAAYVLTRRLDRCFEALIRRKGRSPSISEIAYAHGFSSDTHFSRAFKARFGMNPREAEDRPGGADGSTLVFEDGPAAISWMDIL